MCSINGFSWQDEALVKKMNQVTAHRGPDGTGAFLAPGISLGHNRLAILDLSPAGAQPMTTKDSRFTIVFNGEVYNFKELRKELEDSFTFRSSSDTEVILHAYAKFGAECVKKFNGIFSFVIWDAKEQELFLARDQSGVKPLYYFSDGKRFIFSSEIKGILAHDIPREVDREAFNTYMRMLYVPEPYTMFKDIKKLPPSHTALFKDGQLTLERYWAVTEFSDTPSRADAVHEIRSLFDDSVKRQLISDRPVGVFLSGGMDSSAVLGSAIKTVSGKVKTYSAGFDVDVQREKFNADFELARKTAKHYGTDHHELMLSGKDIGKELKNIAWHMDEPNANPTAGAIYLLSRMAKRDVAVVLGGDGGDELFGGYKRYAISRAVRATRQIPGSVLIVRSIGRKEAERKLHSDATGLFLSFLSQKEEAVSSVLNPVRNNTGITRRHFEKYFAGTDLSGDFEKRFMNTDRQSWLVDESLLRTDKMSMASGLEARVPILDYRLVEYAFRIPTKWKIKRTALFQSKFLGKEIWKEAVKDYLPEHIIKEEKRGWFTPMAKWLRTDLKEPVCEILSNLNPEFFDAAGVRKMWQEHLNGRVYNLNLIWAAVMWQLWYDSFFNNSSLSTS